MKLIDITTEAQLDEVIDITVCRATAFASDVGVADMLRWAANMVEGGHYVEHSVLVALDTDDVPDAKSAKRIIVAASVSAFMYMSPAAVVHKLDEKAAKLHDPLHTQG